MISKSALSFLRKQSNAQNKVASLTVAHQRNFAGGGPKKPAMPASETDFDVVFVGKHTLLFLIRVDSYYIIRWHECYCLAKVHATRWS